jgi:hypothetical protein
MEGLLPNSGNIHSHGRSLALTLLFTITFLVCPLVIRAQTASTGALKGTITDSSGAVLSNAYVKVTSEDTAEVRALKSQVNGLFVVPLLLPGRYRVEVSHDGLKTVSGGFTLRLTRDATHRITGFLLDVARTQGIIFIRNQIACDK